MRKITLISMLIAISMCIFIIEAQIPVPVPFPGVKCGLSNVIVLITMLLGDKKSAFSVMLIRIILSFLIIGQASSMIYSFFGGIAAFLVMAFLSRPLKNYIWVISVFGALSHNAGQIITAAFMMHTTAVFSYIPVLIISGIITGAFTGIIAQTVVSKSGYVKKLFFSALKKGKK